MSADQHDQAQDTLTDLIPPGDPHVEPADLPDLAPAHIERAEPPVIVDPEEAAEAERGALEMVAKLTADSLPPALRETYKDAVVSSELMQMGVAMTGMGAALVELKPKPGAGGAGPVRQLHPALRVLMGLGVMVVGSLLTRRNVLAANGYTTGAHSGGAAGAAAGGQHVQSSQGVHHDTN